ncbi:hypothetical protein GGI11_000516 [Coemansia sp. RSA 2049]|nr:hypothetical protein GGI11_000516 [Coemansia sp. RSA 2049]
MFGTNSAHASGDLRARKRRCAVCGTKRMINREDGRVTCRHGHEQAGVFEESAELIVSGSTRRHVARRRRENKRRMAQSMRLYGRSAHFVIVQALQHILKLQVETLVRDLGAPEALIGAVRNIWLLYVSQLDDQDALDITYAHDQHQGSGTQTSGSAAAATATRTRHPSAFAANSLNTLSATHTYDIPPAEDSIDELLKEIDADIAEDEEDFVAWQRQDKDQTASLLDGSQEVDGGQAPGLEVPSRSAAQQLSRMSRRGGTLLVKEIKRFARIDYLPSILYLGFLWIKSSIMLGDLHYIIAEERIPYVSAYLRIPEEITLRLGQGIGRLFVVPFAPSVKKIAILATAFEKLLLISVGVKFPQQTLPFQMIMLLKRLALPIELYPMAMRAVELGGDVVRAKTKKKGVTFIAMAAIIVCLKLHYGLDEIERKPSGPDSESKLNLPPLDKFLEAWRDDWESEMSIGSIPYMTAYGQNWPTIFAEHYKRLVSSHGTRRTRAVYDDISRRYRSAIDTLAASDRI